MIVRLVKMEFLPEKVDNFIELFEEKKEFIRNFPGCRYLELLQGQKPLDNIFVTYSHWFSEEDLENYRNSELFRETWKETKSMFASKAKAVSYSRYTHL